jgi:pentatricopeptide repeat protein
MEGTQISNMRRHSKHSGCRTEKTHHGWQQRWLQWHQAQCNWPFISWNKRLTKYVMNGQPEEVIQVFQQMQQKGMSPDKFTLVQVINACASVRGLLQISTKDGYLLEIIWKFNWLIPTTRLSVIRLPTFTSTSQNLRVCVCVSFAH